MYIHAGYNLLIYIIVYIAYLYVRDEEALQSVNSEISSEHGVTIPSCASTNKHLGSSQCSLQLNTHNLGSELRMLDD
jgi:hypothetical protein